ncbi:unnamed protein product [Bursaphelenchus xylophilus]|uniref:Ubiquitin carboxyl-terminal hydrolase n=1 Tax=Bursaphelenchus xylophilus TaxID=6326 RepID=A0A1I7RPN0_BURXY|nr:unnamed protein product [Bursaphelenchus xylophilus]CAG9096322.1 unnamed protein product [Bursaphelenchus xylophilus]
MTRKCSHLNSERDEILRNYELLVSRIIYPLSSNDSQIKLLSVQCSQCERRAVPLMCCCLKCPTFACLEHFKPHLFESKHNLVVSTTFGQVYCLECEDFIYDRKIERIRLKAENDHRRRLGLGLRNEWNPSSADAKLLRKAPKAYHMSKGTMRGLRGLVNLGNTCFMNCIIQSLVQIPHLRDYFLTDQHTCKFQLNDISEEIDEENLCLMCELSNIFQEFYNGPTEPFIPRRMLHLVWKHAEHLAGYEQHDAHEFLIAALNVLHQHSQSLSSQQAGVECKCIIDQLFTGRLQSDLTCMKCGRISTTVDPFWDISLDLGDGTSTDKTLEECLANYVKSESLGATAKIKCDSCGSYESATKRLTLKTLPLVACFHLKRFEHTPLNRRKKIRSPVRFPEQIDLSPYTTSYCTRVENGIGGCAANEMLIRSSNVYDLLAVVNHNGNTESGHYSCFVRHNQDQWYKVNDQIISPQVLESVLVSEGYLLFYTKSFIDYD